LGKFFGQSFFVVLRGLGSNFVIFGGRLIEFCLFPFSLSKVEILLRAFLRKKPEVSGLLFRTFSPGFFFENPRDSGKKCGDSGLSR
jgi:hypothetical protein